MKTYMRSIAAALVFIALLVYIVVAERGRVPDKDELFGLDVGQASRLEVAGPNVEYAVEKRDGEWYLVSPEEGLADSESVEGRVRVIAELKPVGTRSDVDLEDEAFGLTEPRLAATLAYGKSRDVRVALGSDTPVGGEVFAKVEGRPELYILSGSVLSTLQQTPDDLREKRLVRMEADDVRSLMLAHEDVEVQVDNTPQEGHDYWTLVRPIQARADEFRTEQVISRLVEMRARDFAGPVDNDAKYGFDKPLITARIADVDGSTATIIIGTKSTEQHRVPEDQDVHYAKVEGRNELMLVAAEDINELRKEPIEFRDRSIVDVEKHNINFVRVQSKKKLSFALKRLPDGWHIDRPVKAIAKEAKVDDILWDIAQLEALEYVDDAPGDLKKYGLAVPDTIMDVHQIGTDKVLKISFGYAHGDDAYYCMTSDSDQVYVVSDMLMLDLPKELEDIKASS